MVLFDLYWKYHNFERNEDCATVFLKWTDFILPAIQISNSNPQMFFLTILTNICIKLCNLMLTGWSKKRHLLYVRTDNTYGTSPIIVRRMEPKHFWISTISKHLFVMCILIRDVSTGSTGATEVAPKFSDTLTLSPPGGGGGQILPTIAEVASKFSLRLRPCWLLSIWIISILWWIFKPVDKPIYAKIGWELMILNE